MYILGKKSVIICITIYYLLNELGMKGILLHLFFLVAVFFALFLYVFPESNTTSIIRNSILGLSVIGVLYNCISLRKMLARHKEEIERLERIRNDQEEI